MRRRADQALDAAKRDGKNQVKQETVGLGPQPGADR
jgi:hypothetical protein